ncbi:tetratricopeptide repeat protein [Novosphingobium aquimarinum]|uniref:tetratricopeptide repeat protein n=1 Tax=Novosphingobium aquimarinum TaxID=2682494 RepID=UPI0018DE276F|nr:tetratricopeptide repeat protein [Novosphingobium aquimarinum]
MIEQARAALERGDGVDAEVKLGKALDAGVPPQALAALMGEAMLARDAPDRARRWLEPQNFTADTAFAGFRALARLEQRDGNLPAAGKAYDKALKVDPDDASLWVEIGRLRYRGGQHALAIEAANHAVALDPSDTAALLFRGQLVRDGYGLRAALPWFEAALSQDPNDVPVLLEYAATLGELNRASEAVVVTRRVLELSPGNPQAYFLQSVIAARAGNFELARALLNRTGNKLASVSAVMLFEATLELGAGNAAVAAEQLEIFLERHPDNVRARHLLARALYLGGEYRYLTRRMASAVADPGADPYLLTTVARAYEVLGERENAAPLLDRAAAPRTASFRPEADKGPVGELLAQGRLQEAQRLAEARRAALPGNRENLLAAGDVQLALGNAAEADVRYAAAGAIRMSDGLLLRRFQATLARQDFAGAQLLVRGYLLQTPTSRTALRLAAILAVRANDLARAERILEYLSQTGSGRDVQLLADLAMVEIGAGDAAEGEVEAQGAYRLQRANPVASQALGLALVEGGRRPQTAAALLDKARAMMGDNALLAQARIKLADSRG